MITSVTATRDTQDETVKQVSVIPKHRPTDIGITILQIHIKIPQILRYVCQLRQPTKLSGHYLVLLL